MRTSGSRSAAAFRSAATLSNRRNRAGPGDSRGGGVRVGRGERGRGERTEDLDPGPERGRPVVFESASPPDARAPEPGLGGQLFRQPGLADARLADDEDDAATSAAGLVEHGPQRGELLFSPDELGGGQLGDSLMVRPARATLPPALRSSPARRTDRLSSAPIVHRDLVTPAA